MLKLIDEHDEWKERAEVFAAALKAAYNERDILRAELAQARKWAATWKEWSKWAFHYCRHNNAVVPFTEEQAA